MMGEKRVSVRLRLFSRRSTDRYGPGTNVTATPKTPQNRPLGGPKNRKIQKWSKLRFKPRYGAQAPCWVGIWGPKSKKKGPPPLTKRQLNVID